MITNNKHIRCDSCGKFISYSDAGAIRYTPYGSSTSTEPPDEQHECGVCVSKMDEKALNYRHHRVYAPAQKMKLDHN